MKNKLPVKKYLHLRISKLIERGFVCFCMVTSLTLLILLLPSCKGSENCGPTEDPQEDADSDCIADSADNCVFTYNPSQVDLDEDGSGVPCDADDTDETIGNLVKPSTDIPATLPAATLPLSQPLYITPQTLSMPEQATLSNPDCLYYLVSCDNFFLGVINNDSDNINSLSNPGSVYGDTNADVSILNTLGAYGQDHAACSAFDATAPSPPAVFCQMHNNFYLAGYLTANPLIRDGIHPCDCLEEINITHDACR
ncbi:MAG: hypothetical protein HQM16_03805 [Deltaproteobacteria bacterium]|nr:hypothetical protein [Deltaproteobacteria bacterium]